MNRRWKKLAVATLSQAGLVVAILAVEHVRGRWTLHRHLAALAANGETVTLDRLLPKPPPPELNSALLLASLSNRWDHVLTKSEAYPPTIRFAGPGRAILTAKLQEWGGGESNCHGWSELEDDLEQAAEVLAGLRSAAERPPGTTMARL